LGAPADEGHKERNERRADEEQEAGNPIERENDGAEDERQESRLGGGGQVTCEKAIKRLDLIDDCRDRGARGRLILAARRTGKEQRKERFAQVALYIFGRQSAEPVAQRRQAGTQDQKPEDEHHAGQKRIDGLVTLNGATDDIGEA
jgi:hypothetical protein